jgi:hypothetical protein
MKPIVHARNCVKKWGGNESDYLPIHEWFDQTKSHFGDNRHRAILHNSFGIFLCEQMFGRILVNSDKREVHVRDIGELHVIEDLGTIPPISAYLQHIDLKKAPWILGSRRHKGYRRTVHKE